MATVEDLIALVATLPPKVEKLAADTDVSHAAGQTLADVTATQAALVQAAQATQTVAVGEAQSTLDAAVAVTDADTKDLDDTITAVVEMANSLKV
jgi:hypothetical protein